jgi:hypothetical protein
MSVHIYSFNVSTLAFWDGSKGPVNFSATLTTMNSGNGYQVLEPSQYDSFLVELNGLQALGAKAIALDIDFPTLDPGFDAYGGRSAEFLDVFKRAVAEIKSRGLKVIIETNASFTQDIFNPLNAGPYFASLTLDQYLAARSKQAAIIASEMNPDYLGLIQEPDTEATNAGKPELGTLPVVMDSLTQAIQAVKATGAPSVLFAGIGTWQSLDAEAYNYVDYIKAFASVPELDIIDVHVYPVIFDYLPRLNTIAKLAIDAGKASP